jgi:hypothetical protein
LKKLSSVMIHLICDKQTLDVFSQRHQIQFQVLS